MLSMQRGGGQGRVARKCTVSFALMILALAVRDSSAFKCPPGYLLDMATAPSKFSACKARPGYSSRMATGAWKGLRRGMPPYPPVVLTQLRSLDQPESAGGDSKVPSELSLSELKKVMGNLLQVCCSGIPGCPTVIHYRYACTHATHSRH